MTRRMAGTLLLAVSAAGVIGEFIVLREVCGSSDPYIDFERGLVQVAEALLFANAFLAFSGLRLVWERAGWSAWLISIGFGLAVGVLSYGAAIVGVLSGDTCRIDL